MAISTYFTMVWTIIFCSTINVVIAAILLDFRVTPPVIKSRETKNVTIQCLVNEIPQFYGNQPRGYFYNERGERVLQQNGRSDEDKSGLALIRIIKHSQSQWQAIAQISSVAPTVAHKLDAGVSGTDGVISDDPTMRSFLQVTWDVATSDVFGLYRCDAISFDSQQNAIIATSQLSFGSSLNALDLSRLLQHDTTDGRETIDQQRQDPKPSGSQTEQLKSELQTLQNKTEHDNLSLAELEKIENRIDDLDSEQTNKTVGSDIGLGSGAVMLWPRGSYGLLQSQSGCPVGGGATWESGWVRHHTESTDQNKDELSTETHLKQPVLEKEGGDNFLTQHFCIKNTSLLSGPDWPKGSYCINEKVKCPDKFNNGYIQWHMTDDPNYNSTVGGSLPDKIQNNLFTVIYYCCRQDGPADVPIYLPNSDPFYLYRYGGKCQQVHGMNVTEEFVLFDTENNYNDDEFGRAHPDGTIDNVRLELCYYRSV